jgi:prepilin-type N-terminal cleavage/methylation domain-containing protein
MHPGGQASDRRSAIVLKSRLNSSARPAGFTLVEMMVALVLGLIVTGAVLALVVAIMKSNQQTIQATRLTQELRATAAVIAAEVRRSRGVADPLSVAKLAGGNPFKDIDTSTAGCILYAYEDGTGGNYRVIRLAGNKVVLGAAATRAAAGCTASGTELTSDAVEITGLTFTRLPLDAGGNPPPPDRVRQIQVTVTGRLASPDPGLAGVTRSIVQSVFVPSIGSGS